MKVYPYIIIFLLSLFLVASLDAQDKRASNWIFGDNASLNFDTYPPKPFVKSGIYQREGVSSVSDSDGNLLFFSDGVNVYSKPNTLMMNGQGLLGNTSTTQSVMIVPSPVNPKIFYVFTQDAVESSTHGMNYNVVDLFYDNGLGRVTVKNQQLLTDKDHTEKISSIYSKDGTKAYVMTKKRASYDYLVYTIDNPFTPTPTTFSGVYKSPHPRGRLGAIKIFAGGTKFASIFYYDGVIEFGDFNPSTGVISNIDSMSIFPGIYSCDFSPDGRYLYVSTLTSPSYILQVNLKTKTYVPIHQMSGTVNDTYGAVQVGIDGVIYVTDYFKNYLHGITQPNNYWGGSGYVHNFIKLQDSTVGIYGLPNLPSTMYYKYGINDDQVLCEGNGLRLSVWTDTKTTDTTSTYTWYHPDGSIISNQATFIKFNVQSSDEGTYTCVIDNMTGTFILTTKVTLKPVVTIDFNEINNDTIYVCDRAYYDIEPILSSPIGAYELLWEDGSTNPNRTIFNDGTYTLQYKDLNGCMSGTFKITIIFIPPLDPSITLVEKTSCPFPTYKLVTSQYSNVKYEWLRNDVVIQTGSDNFIDINSNGIYKLNIINKSCIYEDSIIINNIQPTPPDLILLDSIIKCDEKYVEIELNDLIDLNLYDIMWSNGSTLKKVLYSDTTTTVVVTLTNKINGCEYKDSIYIDVHDYTNLYPFDPTPVTVTKYFNELFTPISVPTEGQIRLINGLDFNISNDSVVFISNDKYGVFRDTLVYTIVSNNCIIDRFKPIEVINIGIINIQLTIQDRVDIGETVCVKILDMSDKDMNLEDLNVEVKIDYNRDVLFKIGIEDVYSINDDVCFIVLLDTIDMSILEISNVDISNDYVEYKVINDSIFINDICVKELRQVILQHPSIVNIYPTPSDNNMIKIDYKTNANSISFLLYDVTGKLVWSRKETSVNNFVILSTDGISPGTYILNTFFDKNLVVTKIIISK